MALITLPQKKGSLSGSAPPKSVWVLWHYLYALLHRTRRYSKYVKQKYLSVSSGPCNLRPSLVK